MSARAPVTTTAATDTEWPRPKGFYVIIGCGGCGRLKLSGDVHRRDTPDV